MSHLQQTAVVDTKTEQIVPISQASRFSIVNCIAMAFEFFFGCWHRKLSRPFTLSGWTYEVCLNCGKKFPYTRAEIGYNIRQHKTDSSPMKMIWSNTKVSIDTIVPLSVGGLPVSMTPSDSNRDLYSKRMRRTHEDLDGVDVA